MTGFWDERYDTDHFFYGTEPNEFLREQASALPPGGTVLCLAEGEGRNAVFLAAAGHRVVALDQSPVGLQKAERLAADKGVPLATVCANLADYRIEAQGWDAIVSIWCHLPPELRASVHRQVVEALKPGGVLLLEAYTPEQLKHGTGGPSSAEMMPTLAQLRQDLVGLDLIHAVELERSVHEGKGHGGLSAVVQVIARKPAGDECSP